MKPNIEPPSCL